MFEPLRVFRLHQGFPAINFYDTETNYIVKAELPGMATEDLDLSITGDRLTLQGERKRPEGVADESVRLQERQFGRWSRTLPLPEWIDVGKVDAWFALGVLTVILPKAERAEVHRIKIKTTPHQEPTACPFPEEGG
ncbi:MAG: Hsp20/alpha crystallin family protein [Isosphaeraceae bacterium]